MSVVGGRASRSSAAISASSASWRAARASCVARSRARSGRSIASHRRANTASALPAITTSRPSARRVRVRGRDVAQDAAASACASRRRARSRRPSTPSARAPLRRSRRRPPGPRPLRVRSRERGQRADDGEQRRERVADRDAGARRRPVGLAGRVADPAHRLADRAEPGFGGAWTGLPEPGDVHEHDARVVGRERVVVETRSARACPA